VSDVPDESLAKIRADIAGYEGLEGESFWAEPLGEDCYRLRNTPWYVYDVNFLDVVRAVPKEPGDLPTIVEVVERSGHETFRVLFDPVVTNDEIKSILGTMSDAAVNYESAEGRFYALDVRPEADYQAVCELLRRLEEEGRLNYEAGTALPDSP
jgi:Domain of unknown function (DUF4265)